MPLEPRTLSGKGFSSEGLSVSAPLRQLVVTKGRGVALGGRSSSGRGGGTRRWLGEEREVVAGEAVMSKDKG